MNFFYALPQFPAEKNVILPLVWPKIVMSLPTLKDMTGVIKRDQFLPYDEGRRQCDIQEQVSKITSRIDTILSTSGEPGFCRLLLWRLFLACVLEIISIYNGCMTPCPRTVRTLFHAHFVVYYNLGSFLLS